MPALTGHNRRTFGSSTALGGSYPDPVGPTKNCPQLLPRNRDGSGVTQGERPPRRHGDHPHRFTAPRSPRHNHRHPSASEEAPALPHAPAPLTRPAPAAPGFTLRCGRGFFSNPTNGRARRRAASWEDGASAAQGSTGSVVPEGLGRLPRFALGRRPRPAGSERPGRLCGGRGAAATRGRQRPAPQRQRDLGCRGKAPWPRPHLLQRPDFASLRCGRRTSVSSSLSELWVITGLLLSVYTQDNHCLQVVRGKRPVTCSMP